MALSLGAEGGAYLTPKQWEAQISYRYLHTDEVFIGNEYHPEFEHNDTGPDITVHSIDLVGTYQITKRLSTTLTLPFLHGEVTVITNHFHQRAWGLGDLRLVGNLWVLDPPAHPDGNVSLGLGLKAPTGDSNVKGRVPGFTERRPVDPSIQPGDGGWGIVLEMQAFQKLFEHAYFYAGGFYLLNPEQLSDTEFSSDPTVRLSVPDQYMGRIGFAYTIWPSKGLSLSLGGRVDGLPVRDLIGGGDPGFRRPGYTVYIEPGISWSWGKNFFSFSGPVAVERNRERSILDLKRSTPSNQVHGAGGLASFLIIASYSRRF